MTTGQLCETLSMRCLAGEKGLGKEVSGCYVGDLLSWVMSRVREGDAWITVMGNVNAVAVAALRDIACIILCDNAHLDGDAKVKADENDICVFMSEKSAFDLAMAVGKLLES